jgi:hypothetical protein
MGNRSHLCRRCRRVSVVQRGRSLACSPQPLKAANICWRNADSPCSTRPIRAGSTYACSTPTRRLRRHDEHAGGRGPGGVAVPLQMTTCCSPAASKPSPRHPDTLTSFTHRLSSGALRTLVVLRGAAGHPSFGLIRTELWRRAEATTQGGTAKRTAASGRGRWRPGPVRPGERRTYLGVPVPWGNKSFHDGVAS